MYTFPGMRNPGFRYGAPDARGRARSRFHDPLRGDDDDARLVCREGAVRLRVGPGAFSYPVHDDDIAAARIRRGDILIVEPRPALAGDWILVLLEGGNRVARYAAQGGRAWIEDPSDPTLRFPARDLVIQGVVTALIRRFPVP